MVDLIENNLTNLDLGAQHDRFTAEEATALLELDRTLCISMYMPTHRAGPDTRQDPIRLKNLLSEAKSRLEEAGVSRDQQDTLLQPAADLLNHPDFWKHLSSGLAMFLADNFARMYRVPVNLQPAVHCGDRFHILPLMGLLSGDGEFYVLALSPSDTRLLHCTRDGYKEIERPEIPDDISELMKYIEQNKQLQWHTGSPPAAGRDAGQRDAVFHGQGAPERHHKDRLLEYFRMVVDAVEPMTGKKAPVVFAGTDVTASIFREAAGDLNVVPQNLSGNADPQRARSDELHERGWELMKPHFEQASRMAMDMYSAAAGSEPSRASNRPEAIARAASEGRIALLILSRDLDDDRHLFDKAAADTFLRGGQIYIVDREDMPDNSPACAVMRY